MEIFGRPRTFDVGVEQRSMCDLLAQQRILSEGKHIKINMNKKQYELNIEELSYDGAGVAKVDGKVFFVPKTLPGEHVLVEVVSEHSRFSVGRVKNIVKKSPQRMDAPCPYFYVCGGCDFQHCSYESELKFKKQALQKELKKCGFEGKIELTKSPKRFHSRNKISFKCKDGKLVFFKAKSHDFFEAKTCLLADEKILDVLPLVEEFLQENLFENLTEVTLKEVENSVAIVFLFSKEMSQFCEKLKKNAKKLQIFNNFLVFFGFGEILESEKTKVFPVNFDEANTQPMHRNFSSFSAPLSVTAFEQVNTEVASFLVDEILSKAKGQKVVNAYSGQGVLTRLLAEESEFVYGIELQKSAHESAQKLCKNMKNVRNLCGKVEDVLPKIVTNENIDTLVLDPPRMGCVKTVLDAINDAKLQNVLYCSCNPATLTRDLKILSASFEICDVHAFDMFPCTANLETLVQLRKK